MMVHDFLAWATQLDLQGMSIKELTRPVEWTLPDILTEPCHFKDFNLRQFQHPPEYCSETLQEALDKVADYVLRGGVKAPVWVAPYLLDHFERDIRILLWLFTQMIVPLSDPKFQTFRYVLDNHSLLIETQKRQTMGYHKGEWFIQATDLDTVRTYQNGRYTKSPLKALETVRETVFKHECLWADVIYNRYAYYAPVPYALRQILSQLRLEMPDALVFENHKLILKDNL